MNRAVMIGVVFFLFVVVLTQVGWLSNGFFGFQAGPLPEGAPGVILLGVIIVLAVLALLKILRWWRT